MTGWHGEPTRIRLRSGDYPGAPPADDPTEEIIKLPANCVTALHRPSDLGNEHPLKRAATVEFYGAPVALAEFVLSPTGILEIPIASHLYLADHRRYGRGGGRWALQWLGEQEYRGSVDDNNWAGRILKALSLVHALVDGDSTVEALLATISPWAFDLNHWVAAFESGWLEGVFSTLSVAFEVLCYEVAAASLEQQPTPGKLRLTTQCHNLSRPHMFMGVEENFCFAHSATMVLSELSRTAEATAGTRAMVLVEQLLRNCDLNSVAGISAWQRIYRGFLEWPMLNSGHVAECSAGQLLHSASKNGKLLMIGLCNDDPVSMVVGNGVAVVHVLGATVQVTCVESSPACVIIELAIHAASTDGCYITQAGSNPRTLPQSFLDDWSCAVSLGLEVPTARKEWTRASVISAFGTDAVLRCGFNAEYFPFELVPTSSSKHSSMHLHLRSKSAFSWEVLGIPLCSKIDMARDSGNPVPFKNTLLRVLSVNESDMRSLSVCTGVMFGADAAPANSGGVEWKRAGGQSLPPTLLEQWLAYHEVLGVDHFSVYDSDGSAEKSVARGVSSGRITYYSRWPSRLSAKLQAMASTPHCRHCISVLAEAHCLWSNRGRSRWVVMLHSFDAYLAVAQGYSPRNDPSALKVVFAALDDDRANIGTVAVPMLDFGGPPQNSTWLISRFTHRVEREVRVLAEIGRGNPAETSWLNHPGVTLRNPENVVGVYDHYSRSRPGAMDVETPFELLRANHYVDTFADRCLHRFAHCVVEDIGLMWAIPAMCNILGLAPFQCSVTQRETYRA